MIYILLAVILLMPQLTKATCPVCTVAIASGLGLCRYIGIDDVVSGLWVGGLLLSLAISVDTALKKKKKSFKFSGLFWLVLTYLMVFVPLQLTGIIGHNFNRIVGMDRLIFGSLCGTLLVVISALASDGIKKRNKGKVLFNYQKVVIPVVMLLVFSFIFYATIC